MSTLIIFYDWLNKQAKLEVKIIIILINKPGALSTFSVDSAIQRYSDVVTVPWCKLGRSFEWDREKGGPVSQQAWHDKDPTLLRGCT